MKKKSMIDEYLSLSSEARQQLVEDLYAFIKSNFSNSEFGYESLWELGVEYDERVLSRILGELKDSGLIESTGYMIFKIKK